WHGLVRRGGLGRGATVLIGGASGGVNTASIQIAKLIGAKVYVVGSDAEKLAEAQRLGADELIDRSAEDWSKAVFARTNRQGVDVVVDNVGKETIFGSIRSVRPGGRIMIVRNRGGRSSEIVLR